MKKVFSLLLVLMLVLSIAVPGMAASKAKTKITLDQKGTVTLEIGNTLQLHATVTPDAAITWKSSKKSVATVENGLVKPVKEGKATITAKAGGKTAKVTIKVVDPTKPTKLALKEGKKVTLDIDKTLKLTPAFTPATASSDLTYKTSKKSVATVENGFVIPHKEGTTKIAVTCTKNKKAKATITVTVKDPYKPTKLVIDQGKSVTLTAGSTLALTATLAPATAKAELTFKSSKKSVASVDASGKVTAIKKGTAKITITAKNNKKAKATITVKVTKANVDLSKYIGCNAKTVADMFKFKVIEYHGSIAELSSSRDDSIIFFADISDLEEEGEGESYFNSHLGEVKIVGLELKKPKNVNVMGIAVGMQLSKVDAQLRQSGWTRDSSDESASYTKNGNPDRSLDIHYNKKGIVTCIYYSAWDYAE